MSGRYLILALLLLFIPLYALADTLVVADHAQALAAPLIRHGDEILAPLTPSLPLLGATIAVDGNAITLTSSEHHTLKLKIGSLTAVTDDSIFTLDAAPRLVDGDLYLPVHGLANWLEANVRFQPDAGVLTLTPLLTVTSEPRDGGLAMLVHCRAPLQYTSGHVADPPRAYFDFKHVAVGKPEPLFEIGKNGVGRIRLSQNSIAPDIVRLVVDLTEEKSITPTVTEHGRLVTVLLPDTSKPVVTPAGPSAPPATPDTTPAAPTPATTPNAAPEAPPDTPRVIVPPQTPVKLTGITLAPHAAKQSELLIATDSPVPMESDYKDAARQLTVHLPTARSEIDADSLKKLTDATVDKVEVLSDDPAKPGLDVRVTLHKGADYLIEKDDAGIHVLAGTFSLGNMVITLDAGHGGHDTGAIGCNRTLEKTVTLDVILRVSKLLSKDGAKVLLTRKDDTFIPLDDRPALANNNNADLFLSVHCNSCQLPNSCSGTQVYYKTPQSIPLSSVIHEELLKGTGLKDGGIRTANYLVLRKSRMPAVLLEIAFINNTKEECLLCDEEYLQKVAVSIANGVRHYAATKAFRLWHAANHVLSAKPPAPDVHTNQTAPDVHADQTAQAAEPPAPEN